MSIQSVITRYSRSALAALFAILLPVLGAQNATAATPYFSDNFDSGQKTNANGFVWGAVGSKVNVVNLMSFSGSDSLQFHYGPDAPGADSHAEQRYFLASGASSAPKEVWIQYMWRVPSNFKLRSPLPNNDKLFSIWAENYSTVGDIQATFEYERSDDTSAHLRVLCMSDANCRKDKTAYLQKVVVPSMLGKWTRIRIHVKAGTSGAIQVWRDNTLVYSNTNLNLYFSGGNNYWRRGYFMGWANTGFAQSTDFYIDDVKIYKTDPGWAGAASQTPPPVPPQLNVSVQ